MTARCHGDEARGRGSKPFVEPAPILAPPRGPVHGVVGVPESAARLSLAPALPTRHVNASTAKSRRYSAIAKRSVMPAT